jgi:deazaflavin-dependent oxidoreductase (nitroreductase family)
MPSPEIQALNRSVIEEFRVSNGKVTHPRLKDAQLVLLTTTGARTGQSRTTPLAYFSDGPGRIVLRASAMAAPTHPAWYHNLAADPHVAIELGTDTGMVEHFDSSAVTATGAERDRLFSVPAANRSEITAHQDRTARQIPLVVVRYQPRGSSATQADREPGIQCGDSGA